ncbi:MAG: J domain-containing protein [Hyphomicrobium sp.]
MFERNRVDNRAETLIAVEITLADASTLAGRAVLPPGKGVHKLLDGDEAFLYVEVFDGDGAFVPKSEIRNVKVIAPARNHTTALFIPDARNFDPHRVLGLEKGASFEQIRDAYHRLSKVYHPDRFASIDLPREVKAYLDAMTKNVNAAFQALRYIGQKQQPIYSRKGA